MDDSLALNGKVALVTGAGQGIGAATAQRLARDGYRVVVVDLTPEATAATVTAIESIGGSALGLACDVSDEDAVTQAFDRVAGEWGGVQVLVNNAGVTRDNLLFKMSTQDWDTVMAVHLRGSFLCARAAQAQMTPGRWGRIVNLSSVSALGNRGQANYAAAKAGIQGFTKTLAIELGPFGITVNAVAPGFIRTGMTETMAQRMGVDFAEHMQAVADSIPMRRVGQPDDIANVVSFLSGPDCSYVSGQVIYVAGGPRT